MLNVILTSGLGFGFWIAAARLFPSHTVGRDSAMVSAMVTVSTVFMLNLSSVVLRFLPITKLKPTRFVLSAYGLGTTSAAVGGTAFVMVAPRVSEKYRFIEHDPKLAVLFIAAVAIWAVFALQDAVLIASRRAAWVPLENGLFGILKLAVLPVLLFAGATSPVFVGWIIPGALLVIPVNYLIFTQVLPKRVRIAGEPSPVESFGKRGLLTFMAQDYAGTILFMGSTSLIPVLVLAVLGDTQGAYFYMPFTLVNAFDLLFVNLCSPLTVEGAMSRDAVGPLARRLVARFGCVLLGGSLVLVAGASVVLLPFGAHYATAGASVLRLLACASLCRAVIALYSAIARVQGKGHRVLAIQATVFGVTAGLAIVLGRAYGLNGIGIAWLAGNLVAAGYALPHVLRVLRQRPRIRHVVEEPIVPMNVG